MIGVFVVGIAYLPLLAVYLRDLCLREHYRFFPVFLVVVLMLGWKRWQDAPPVRRVLPLRALIVLFASAIASLALASFLRSPVLAFVSAMLATAGGLLVATRRRAMSHTFGIWCLLWLGFRLPFQLDLQLIVWLQTLTTEISSRLLDAFSIMHLTDGHVLSFGKKDFFIDQACSGVMSVMALIAVGALLAVMQNRALFHTLMLLVAACAWALLMNVLRILMVAVVHVRWEADLSFGWRHEVLGWGAFALAVGGILSTDRLLQYFLSPMGRRSRTNVWIRVWNRLTRLGEPTQGLPGNDHVDRVDEMPSWWRRSAVFVLALLIGLQVSIAAFDRSAKAAHGTVLTMSTSPDKLFNEESIRPANASWTLAAFDKIDRHRRSAWGEHSLIWTFRHDETVIRFALDYPFYEHHDLRVCYAGRGWKTLYRQVIEENRSAAEMDLYKEPTNEHAYSLAGSVDASGEWIPWPKATFKERIAKRFAGDRYVENTSRTYYQLQAFVVSSHRLGSFQRSDLREAFQDFQRQIAQRIQEATEKSPFS